MSKNWYSIKAVEGAPAVEVSILDYIGMFGVNAQQFLNDLKAAKAKGDAKKLVCYINSPGGSVFEALAIFNGLRASGMEIEIRVLGVAASAASYIAMAGDKIVMPANTYLFIHNPINAVYGNADEMREMADVLDKIGAGLKATYLKRWKGEASVLEDMLAAETYLTAAECLEHGLCDEVTPEILAEAAFEVDRLPENLQAVFRKAQAKPEDPPPAPGPDLADYIVEACKAAGIEAHASAFAADPKLTTREHVVGAVAEAATILKLAAMAQLPDMGPAAIKARQPLAEFRDELNAARVKLDEETAINTAPKSKPTAANADGFSVGKLWGDIHEMQARSILK